MIALSKTSNPLVLSNSGQQAHAELLRKIFGEQSDFVWRTLRHLGVARADLEDAMQEVFVVVHKRLAGYEERASLRGWLYAICIRVCSRYRRSHGRRREDTLAELPEVHVDPVQQLHIERREDLELGRSLIEALPEKQRMVFVLYEVEHMAMAEIAETLGCPIPTAYARLNKARVRVRSELARQSLRGRSLP